MQNFTIIKEPGFIYDLFYLFTLHFNKNSLLKSISDSHARMEEQQYCENLLDEYGPFSNELLPFFVLRKDQTCFMSRYYFSPYKHRFATDYDLAFLQSELADNDQVITRLLRFYFPDISDDTVQACAASPKTVFQLIKASKYPTPLKAALYEFFLDPVPAIQKLIYELTTKGQALERQYERSLKMRAELQENLDWDELNLLFGKHAPHTVDFSQYEAIFVSFCLNHKTCICIQNESTQLIILLGKEYKQQMESIASNLPEIRLRDFGSMIADETRQKMLDVLMRKGEVTIRDIMEEFGVTNANAYYHMNMLVKAEAVKARNQGRTLYYSLNSAFFDKLCDWLSRFKEEKGDM